MNEGGLGRCLRQKTEAKLDMVWKRSDIHKKRELKIRSLNWLTEIQNEPYLILVDNRVKAEK